MTMTKMTCTLSVTLLVMLAVIALRAEATRYHHELAVLDRRANLLWQQVWEEEIELARLRNPALIRARVAELRLGGPVATGVRSGVPPQRP
ncbi:MAG: hypothetical protein KKB50_02060 [Planctomycetes bacterium]|nr:hypothetical protein [Planctomycetota bacterium]